MIARTETAFANIKGTEFGWKQSGVVSGSRFVLAPDACPWCEAMADQMSDAKGVMRTVPLGESYVPFGTRLTARFQEDDGTVKERTMELDYAPDGQNLVIPPVHPHCRCSREAVLEGE